MALEPKENFPSDPRLDRLTKHGAGELSLDDEETAAAYKAAVEKNKLASATTENPLKEAAAPSLSEKSEGELVSSTHPAKAEEKLKTQFVPPLDPMAKVGNIIAWVAAPLVLILFIYAQAKHAASGDDLVKSSPNLPMKGKLLDVTSASSGWKVKTDEDKVSGVNELITHRLVYPSRLPTVTLTISPKNERSFLRVLFLDSDGQIAGDPRLVRIENGKVAPATVGSSAEKIISSDTVQITGSAGFVNRNYLDEYCAGNKTRWSIEISESDDYKARGDSWKKLQTFSVENKEL